MIAVTGILNILKSLLMDIADGKRHVSNLHHELAVAVHPYYISLAAAEYAGGEAHTSMSGCIFVYGVEEYADTCRVALRDTHERLHYAI